MFGRYRERQIAAALAQGGKVVVLYGPRQVGKTTLLQAVMAAVGGRSLLLNGDFVDDRHRLRPERPALAALLQGVDHLFVDEAQNVPDIGVSLKLVHDHFPAVRVLATGSSSLALVQRTGEPLTGRQRTFLLYPISYAEQQPDVLTGRTVLERAMVYGSYPEVLGMQDPDARALHLRQLAGDALLKDLFAHVDVNRRKLFDILRLLALQIGAEASLSEIASTVQIDAKTVGRYLDLLEDTFVIVRLRGFSRNLRKEVGKSQKVYFVDLGIRNALLNAFQPLSGRDDVGRLWENLMVVERVKCNAYAGIDANYWFWRTYDRQEIDLIEETASGLRAFEFKWGKAKKAPPKLFAATYPDARVDVIDPDAAHALLQQPAP